MAFPLISVQDPEEGAVTLADGTTLKADLVIGADGIHSVAVRSVIGYANPAIAKGVSCFRFLLPSEELIEDPETEALMENHEGKAQYYVVAQGQNTKRIVCTPVESMLACSHLDNPDSDI